MAAPKYERFTAVVLFADLVGSAEVGNSLGANAYWDDYISNFYAAVSVARKKAELPKPPSCRIRLAGDECIIFYRGDAPNTPVLEERVHQVLRFTYVLKATWFISPFNIARMKDHKAPREIAVGAHSGVILEVEDQFGVIRDLEHRNKAKEKTAGEPWFVGHTINVAKRIESVSRERRNLNTCVSAPIGRVVRERAKTMRTNGELQPANIIYGLLGVGDTEHRDMKNIEPTVRVNELLPSWESGGKGKEDVRVREEHCVRVGDAKKIIEGILADPSASAHVTDGAALISNFYTKVRNLRKKPCMKVADAVEPLLDYADINADDSWSVMLVGLSLLSISQIDGINNTLGPKALDTGKKLMVRLLEEMPSADRTPENARTSSENKPA